MMTGNPAALKALDAIYRLTVIRERSELRIKNSGMGMIRDTELLHRSHKALAASQTLLKHSEPPPPVNFSQGQAQEML